MSYLSRISQNFNKTALTPVEMAYYSRQILLPNIGITGQRKLKAARVIVIGAGGLGCSVLQSLVGAGIGHISIIDGDDISISNLSRQWLYRYEDKGKNKAILAAKRLQEVNTFIEFEAHPEMLEQANAYKIIKSHDLVIDATDALDVRYLIDDVCADLDCPWVHAALYREKAHFTVFWASCGASFNKLYPEPSKVPSCSETGILGAHASLIGNMQAIEAIKIITGNAQPKVGVLISLDSEKYDIHIFNSPNVTLPILYSDDYDFDSKYAISAKVLQNSITSEEQFVILDIRNKKQFDKSSIQDAINYPAECILEQGFNTDSAGKILLVCEEGLISSMLANALNQNCENVHYLEGGLQAWYDLNLC